MKYIEDGIFTGWVCTALIVVGIGISYATLKYAPPSIWSVFLSLFGFSLIAIGGLSSRARLLKIKPFDNSYKKARKSYEVKDEEQDKS
ncbi:hypothetical protein CBA19CS22_30560 [Caballeronia novacaledonica]|jgi:hypothetical protein|uniref:Uncharacterized protein n=1 Tax=Caballeronia novacaledonica TaxID=1544861 RepID=A0ACB5R0N7_9BURK|nr:hypothetical protein [Caballeronia sp. EK]MBC8639452.1 hypothetical protein [Caballeronia sp. EK]GJH20976.1 hypothetical protein CBA19CS22_30560 [Caballeronia novacaledonica]